VHQEVLPCCDPVRARDCPTSSGTERLPWLKGRKDLSDYTKFKSEWLWVMEQLKMILSNHKFKLVIKITKKMLFWGKYNKNV